MTSSSTTGPLALFASTLLLGSPSAWAQEPYDTWATLRFGASASNPAIAGPDKDPDGDAWKNAVEYLLDLIPTANSEPSPDTHSVTNGQLNLQFTSTDRADARVLVQVADSPAGPWTLAASSEHGADYVPKAGFTLQQAPGIGTHLVSLGDSQNSAPRRFARLVVEIIGLPPTISLTSPADGAIALPTGIAVTFSQAMNPGTLTIQSTAGACTGSLQISSDDFQTCLPCAGGVTMSVGDTVATIAPAIGLAQGTTYKVRVLDTVERASGAKLGSVFTMANGFTTLPGVPSPAHVVISQVYGAGGNSGATFNADFIELHNPLPISVNIPTYALQYAAATGPAIGSNWSVRALTGASISPGGYLLVQTTTASATNGIAISPAPDLSFSTPNLAAAAGKVALTSSTAPLNGPSPTAATIVDLVGYGATANFSETDPAPAPSVLNSVQRRNNGNQDTDNNSADFQALAAAPRNSSSPAHIASSAINETGLPGEADYAALQFPASLSVATGQTSQPIYAQLFEVGLTESAGSNGSIRCEIGYGPLTANPQYQAGWTWVTASFNVQAENNDEYQASFTAPVAGSYAYTARFSFDGVNWTYADLNGAGSNAGLGFDLTRLGVMTVTE